MLPNTSAWPIVHATRCAGAPRRSASRSSASGRRGVAPVQRRAHRGDCLAAVPGRPAAGRRSARLWPYRSRPRGQAVLLDVAPPSTASRRTCASSRRWAAPTPRSPRSGPRRASGCFSIGEEAGEGQRSADRGPAARSRRAWRPPVRRAIVQARDLFERPTPTSIVRDGFTGNIALKVGEGVVGKRRREMAQRGAGGTRNRCRELGARLLARRARSAASRERVDVRRDRRAPRSARTSTGLALVGHGRSRRRWPGATASPWPIASRQRVAGAAARRRRRPADARPTRIASAAIALVLPGRGSQRVGMGRSLAPTRFRSPGGHFAEADAALGAPLSRLMFEGPRSGSC